MGLDIKTIVISSANKLKKIFTMFFVQVPGFGGERMC